MFRYIIIIIIYEVPTPGRAEKNGAENKKSCRKKNIRARENRRREKETG